MVIRTRRTGAVVGCLLLSVLPACPDDPEEATEAIVESPDDAREWLEEQGWTFLDRNAEDIPLESPNGTFEIGPVTGGIEIDVPPAVMARCRRYCWATVMREYLDLVPVTEHTKVQGDPPDAPDVRRKQEDRNVDGWVVDNGTEKDICQDAFERSGSFLDEPEFPARIFEENRMNDDAVFFLARFETCVRCETPGPGPWLGCVEWAYAKIKPDGPDRRGRSYLITKDEVEPAPSENFTRAVDRWTRESP